MADRIIRCQCPHCFEETDVFILIGQNFQDTCEHCKNIIYFDLCGNPHTQVTDEELKEWERQRDEYYDNLCKR